MYTRRILFFLSFICFFRPCLLEARTLRTEIPDPRGFSDDSPVFIWPMPQEFSNGNEIVTVDPNLRIVVAGNGRNSSLIQEAFQRYKGLIFKHHSRYSGEKHEKEFDYDITKLRIIVDYADESLKLGTDESYTLYVAAEDGQAILTEATLEANTVYGALRGLETFSQLCTFNFVTKNVEVYKAPWYIQDSPRFAYRGLLLDTSRHYLPIAVIKRIIESMTYAKLNILHWHIVDEESFPLEVPSYPNLWNGAYTKWERYTLDDAAEIVELNPHKSDFLSFLCITLLGAKICQK